MVRQDTARQASDVRISDVGGSVQRTLVDCVRRLPDLTEEEILAALLQIANRRVTRQRNFPPGPAGTGDGPVPPEWVAVFDAAVAAVGCGSCGRTEACRCHVPESDRPDKTAAGLAAVVPLIAASLEERTGAHC